MWCSSKSLQNNDLRWMIHTTFNLIHFKSDMEFFRKPCHVDILRDQGGFRFKEVGIDRPVSMPNSEYSLNQLPAIAE